MRKKRQIKEKRTIADAIAHLNGYAVTMKVMTGYHPVAVFETIEELKQILSEIKEVSQ
jgi:hypothetical protein